MLVGGLATLGNLSLTTITSYIYVFLTQYFVAPTGHIQAPHCAPVWRSPHTATFAPLGNSGRKWLHTQRMSPHRQTTTPFNCGSKVGGVTGERECRRAHECACVRCVQRAASDQRSAANSLNESCFRVWVILRNVRHVWLSVHMCLVWFFREVCLCMCTRGQVVQVETYDMMWTLLIAHLCTVWREVCMCVLRWLPLKPCMTFSRSRPLKRRTEGGHFNHIMK